MDTSVPNNIPGRGCDMSPDYDTGVPRFQRAQKKSWIQLKHAVRDIRYQLYNTACKIPSNVVFSRKDENNIRVYFLSSVATGREMTLHYIDVSSNGKMSSLRPLFESKFHSLHPYGKSSKEEQLQLERKRVMMWGITSFDFIHPGHFAFTSVGSVFKCTDNLPVQTNGSSLLQDFKSSVFPEELKGCAKFTRLDPQLCPFDSNVVAYVANNDIWVYNCNSEVEQRLTLVHVQDPTLSAGCPCYVTQEEFNRFTGFWWCPVQLNDRPSATSCGDDGKVYYTILYEIVDEGQVDVLHIPSCNSEYTSGVEAYRFPRAGTPNAKSSLRVVSFCIDNDGSFVDIQHYSIVNPYLDCAEYLLRAGWTPDGRQIWAQLLNRRQDALTLICVNMVGGSYDTSGCVPSLESPMETEYPPAIDDNLITNVNILLEEQSRVWINVHDVLTFFDATPQSCAQGYVEFLWASEVSGYRHLYLYRVEKSSGALLEKRALTSGKWEVSEKDVWVDQANRLCYFVGLRETPLEKHLYVVDIDDPNRGTECLTQFGNSYQIFLCPKTQLLVAIESSLSQPAYAKMYRIISSSNENPVGFNGCAPSNPPSQGAPSLGDYRRLPTISFLGNLMEPVTVDSTKYRVPEIFSYTLSSNDTVYGVIFKPKSLDESQPRKFPTVLTIYGGPEVQLVTNSFKGLRHLRHHLLSAEDYCVVTIDCRGSRNRGVMFESHLKNRMGQVEIEDQVEVLTWLSKQKKYIDLERVAIHGWSYGGYLSLMGLAQWPDVFKLAVAGAPVTQWNLYDTGYTERYMDLPENNPDGYQKGSVLHYIHGFPDEENRLLIIHGLMDENVHFAHTTSLIDALIKAGKPYQLQVYPMERHSLRHLATSEHYETTLLSFLQQHL